jgi:hypothetical protein
MGDAKPSALTAETPKKKSSMTLPGTRTRAVAAPGTSTECCQEDASVSRHHTR